MRPSKALKYCGAEFREAHKFNTESEVDTQKQEYISTFIRDQHYTISNRICDQVMGLRELAYAASCDFLAM
jgi:hypothetical protein